MTSTSSAIFENNVRSTLLLGVTAALVLVAAWALGYTLGNIPMGIGIGVLACVVIIPIQMATTKAAILTITKGRPANASDPRERQLLDRIAQLSRNAGLTRVPPLYVTSAQSPNAFASGLGESSAFVCVTQGLLDTMSLDEISGVIGHELTHIRNKDTRTLIVSIVFVGIFSAIISIAFRLIWNTFLFGGDRNRNNKNGGAGIIVILLIAAVLAAIGYFFALLTRFAISRKREYVADAGGAELCGNPLALASALRKISNDPGLGHVSRADVAQLFIIHPKDLSQGIASFMNSLFSTHPDTEKRIQLLEQF